MHPGFTNTDLPAILAYDAEQAPGRHALQALAQSLQRCQQAGAAQAHDDPSRWLSWSGPPCTGWSRCGWTGPASSGRRRLTRWSTRPSGA